MRQKKKDDLNAVKGGHLSSVKDYVNLWTGYWPRHFYLFLFDFRINTPDK